MLPLAEVYPHVEPVSLGKSPGHVGEQEHGKVSTHLLAILSTHTLGSDWLRLSTLAGA